MATMLQTIVSALKIPFLARSRQRGVRVLSDYNAFVNPFADLTNGDFLGIPSVLAAVRLISETCGTLPLHFYEKLPGDQGRREASGQPVADVFRKPNRTQTQAVLRTELFHNAICYGAGYARIERDSLGNAVKLIPYHPETVSISRDAGVDSDTVYRIEIHGEPVIHVLSSNMLVVTGFLGRGLMDICGQSMELTRAAEEYAVNLFRRGCRPGGILTHPGRLSNEAKQRLRRDWEAMHSGADNAGRVGILEEGLTWQEVSGNANEAQTVEQREFQIREVCRIFGIPPSKLGVAGANYSSMEQENIGFLQNCIQPWLARFEQEATAKLVPNGQASRYFWSHSIEGLLRADIISRYKSYAVARTYGFLSPNDIRRWENLSPIPGGDVYLSPLNMQPITPDLGSPGSRMPAGGEQDGEDPLLGVAPPAADQAQAPAVDQAQQDVQAAALNGAQVTALVDLALKVAGGLLPKPAAIAIAKAAFPSVSEATIAAIFGNIKDLSPEQMAAGTAVANSDTGTVQPVAESTA